MVGERQVFQARVVATEKGHAAEDTVMANQSK
jgi:hypothetical protein